MTLSKGVFTRIAMRALLALLVVLALPLSAQESDWQNGKQARVRLISGVTATGNLAEIPLGLEVIMTPGWKTYWRVPGDAGAPPEFDWSASQTAEGNLDHVELLYPAPQRFMAFGLETVGYQDQVVFPLRAVVKNPGAPLNLTAKLTLLTCHEICIPNDFTLNLSIPSGDAAPSVESEQLKTWRARVPARDPQSWSIAAAQVSDKGEVQLHFAAASPLQAPEVFVENEGGGIFEVPKITLESGGKTGTIELHLRLGASLPNPPRLNVTLTDGGRGWEQEVMAETPVLPSPIAPPVPAPASLFVMLVFAFLGGMILNLMPCVLPVLSLKLLKFMGHGGRENRDARRSFLAAAAGIATFFLILAALMLGLRAAGQSVGWGIQFQHPAFLAFIVIILLLFAANLWGVFEIRIPGALNDKLAAVGAQPKLAGDFLSGAFAALLATPCTAPFLGTAIGFALGAGTAEILMIFLGMGAGMAVPYLAIAAFPALATRMPRPGVWMLRLKRMLAVVLLVTASWFGYILSLQTQTETQNFDEAAIARHVAEGKIVFVDVTAAWCITCQANKKFVLETGGVKTRLAQDDIVFMQRDWTKPNPDIAAYLRRYGRGGIPFNIVFGPGAPEGIILPELLTPGAVYDALDKAAAQR